MQGLLAKKTPETFEMIARYLTNQNSPQVRDAALDALREEIRPPYRKDTPALQAYRQQITGRFWTLVEQCLQDHDRTMKFQAIQIITRERHQESIPALTLLQSDPHDIFVRQAAQRATTALSP